MHTHLKQKDDELLVVLQETELILCISSRSDSEFFSQYNLLFFSLDHQKLHQ